MARYDLKTVKVVSLSKSMPYCFRYRLPDSHLQDSIRRCGLLTPIMVMAGERPAVISGHRRLYAARVLKIGEIPAVVVRELKPRDAFYLNLVLNWKQGCSEMDRTVALGMATRNFHFKDAEILSLVMPLLGLPADKALLEFFRKAGQFPVSLKDLIEDGRLPVRGLSPFLKFSIKDQDYFARNAGISLRLTSAQLLQTGEWLADIMKRSRKSLRELCRKHGLPSERNQKGMDPRTKADRFFSRVKALRFPAYAKYSEAFDRRKTEILKGAKEFRLEPIQGFEEPGFELHARVKNFQELERLIEKLSRDRFSLNSLFEITL